jgi:hypothetical protein
MQWQWVHDACARIDAKKIKEEDPYLCGCVRIDNGKFVIKRYVFCYIKLSQKNDMALQRLGIFMLLQKLTSTSKFLQKR